MLNVFINSRRALLRKSEKKNEFILQRITMLTSRVIKQLCNGMRVRRIMINVSPPSLNTNTFDTFINLINDIVKNISRNVVPFARVCVLFKCNTNIIHSL